jgi:hypothetical protein
MLDFIALPVLLPVTLAGFAFLRSRRRAGHEALHFLRDLSPVSGQWLADYRRIG